jgi:hypothetical protein
MRACAAPLHTRSATCTAGPVCMCIKDGYQGSRSLRKSGWGSARSEVTTCRVDLPGHPGVGRSVGKGIALSGIAPIIGQTTDDGQSAGRPVVGGRWSVCRPIRIVSGRTPDRVAGPRADWSVCRPRDTSGDRIGGAQPGSIPVPSPGCPGRSVHRPPDRMPRLLSSGRRRYSTPPTDPAQPLGACPTTADAVANPLDSPLRRL